MVEKPQIPNSAERLENQGVASESAPCRLCGGRADYWGSKRLLHRFAVSYFRCCRCGSLETEEPYWLEAAYDVTGVGEDIGAAQRTIDLVLKTSALLDRIGLPSGAECIDFGGGIGLFTRLMRDRGFNFLSFDRYATPFFSDSFNVTSLSERSPAVMTAFEVLEHFSNPVDDLSELFDSRPALVIATTELFTGQDRNWPYLAEATGQHIFFYSPRALRQIAQRFGYALALVGGLIVFVDIAALGRLGISAREAVGKLRMLSRGDRLLRYGLNLFVEHQTKPSQHILQDVEEHARRRAELNGSAPE